MSPENFAYWLQGFVEIAKRMPTEAEWKQICDHLQTVFHKVTPASPTPSSLADAIWAGTGAMIC